VEGGIAMSKIMTDEEYKSTQDQMIDLCAKLSLLNFTGYIERNSLADTTGPFIDPTMYRDAAPNMLALRRVAMCCQALKLATEKLRVAVLETAMAGKMILPGKNTQ
jgi:hypothetical protein